MYRLFAVDIAPYRNIEYSIGSGSAEKTEYKGRGA